MRQFTVGIRYIINFDLEHDYMTLGVPDTVSKMGRKAMSYSPLIEWFLVSSYHLYLRTYLYVMRNLRLWAYDADLDLYNLIWVDPEDIRYGIKDGPPFNRSVYLEPVKEGNWDRDTWLFSESVIYQSLKAHFTEEVPWEDTELYDRALRQLENGNHCWGCDSITEFHERCEQLEELYEAVRSDGYKTQRELEESSDPISRKSRYIELDLQELNEVQVHIGRSGEILFKDGAHRLSIAKLLGVEEVPVCVIVRHKKWQEIRETAVNYPDQISSEHISHPDIQNLIAKPTG